MAPPELLEIAEHRCFKGTLYRFEHISPVHWLSPAGQDEIGRDMLRQRFGDSFEYL